MGDFVLFALLVGDHHGLASVALQGHTAAFAQIKIIGLNLPSGEMGRKDLIKIENTFLTDEQVNQLSLYAPQATVNRIDDYEVVGKSRPSLPDRIDSVLVCPNSNCISHAEPVSSSFAVKKRADDIALKCKYCEKEFSHYVVLAN